MGTGVKEKEVGTSFLSCWGCRRDANRESGQAIQELLRAAAWIISMEHRSGMIISGGNRQRK